MNESSAAPVGLVGLGAMGSKYAESLLDAGLSVAVYDNRPEAMQPFAERDATLCSGPADVADRAETVLVSLPTPDVVREAVAGDGGVLDGKALRTFVDTSTTGLEVARELAVAAERRGVDYLDAPVSGGVRGAEKGTLSVFAAGKQEVFDGVSPLLAHFASTVLLVGTQPGHGQMAKVINNMLSAAAMAITSEALAVGMRAGLQPDALLEAVNSGSGRNTATAGKFPSFVVNRRFDSGFRLELMLKDVRLCLAAARAQGLPMFLGSTVEQLWGLGAERTRPGSDHTEIVRIFEEWAGVQIESATGPSRADA